VAHAIIIIAVVVAVIVIAVVVAVSIAVAAWMLLPQPTYNLPATEQLSITNLTFNGNGTVSVTMRNRGTKPVTITEIHVNFARANLFSTVSPAWNGVVAANSNSTQAFTFAWTNGTQYAVELISSQGNRYAYTKTAPASPFPTHFLSSAVVFQD